MTTCIYRQHLNTALRSGSFSLAYFWVYYKQSSIGCFIHLFLLQFDDFPPQLPDRLPVVGRQ